jgi:hypothetical protein
MNGTAIQGFLKRLVTLQAYGCFSPGPEFELAGRQSRRCNDKRTRQAKGANDRMAEM